MKYFLKRKNLEFEQKKLNYKKNNFQFKAY